jgi:hypothetical protein
MTRKEIINEINCLLSELDNGDDAVSYLTQNDVNWLKENIKALEQEQKWTPVAEGLPKKDGLYLVSVKNDHLRRYSKTCWYSDKNWFARQDVVAWMPLPEPYRAESENA